MRKERKEEEEEGGGNLFFFFGKKMRVNRVPIWRQSGNILLGAPEFVLYPFFLCE